MKTAVICLMTVLVLLAGCSSPATSNLKREQDELERIKQESMRYYQQKDGSLDPGYALDLLLNGSGRDSRKPVFDQPRNDPRP